VVVQLDGRPTTIRLIGVDTPETVHPSKPVERHGKEASAFLRELVGGQSVRLEYEPAMKRLDLYGRTLAYLRTVPGDKLVNLAIVEGGYGHAYTTYPFTLMERFRRAERDARQAKRGLWGDDPVQPKVGKETGSGGQGGVHRLRHDQRLEVSPGGLPLPGKVVDPEVAGRSAGAVRGVLGMRPAAALSRLD